MGKTVITITFEEKEDERTAVDYALSTFRNRLESALGIKTTVVIARPSDSDEKKGDKGKWMQL